MSSIKNRVQHLEQNNKVSVLGQKVHFASLFDRSDELNAETLCDIAARETSGQRCILFSVVRPKQSHIFTDRKSVV